MLLDRRALLKAAGSLATVAATHGAIGQEAAALRAPLDAGAKLRALLDAIYQEDLQLTPEDASLLGLDVADNANLKRLLTDRSPEGRAKRKAHHLDQIARLKAFDPRSLSFAQTVDLEAVLYTKQIFAALEQFTFGDARLGPAPYVVSQMTGAYREISAFMQTKVRIETADDAEAYLTRLSLFGKVIDDNSQQMRSDAATGVRLPDFLLDAVIAGLRAGAVPAAQSALVTSFQSRLASSGLPASYGDRAMRVFEQAVLPAIQRQLAVSLELRKSANSDAGMWKNKDGAAYYSAALECMVTRPCDPDEIHRFGVDEAQRLLAQLDVELRAQGFTQGTVGARITALAADPRQVFPNSEIGRKEAIDFCRERLEAIRKRMPGMFSHVTPYGLEIQRMPAVLAGGAGASSQAPSLDGSRPQVVYFDLSDTAQWPRFELSTTVYHEGLPGHAQQSGVALSNKDLPLIRRSPPLAAYSEGWALYAEQLADEMGAYADDRAGRIGYLKMQLFRANRCIVDTGIHHLRWTRDRAIAHLVESQGEVPAFAQREVHRYCAIPGQACAYKLGQAVFFETREAARRALGPRFDIRSFHDAVLAHGRLPLQTLKRVAEHWAATRHA